MIKGTIWLFLSIGVHGRLRPDYCKNYMAVSVNWEGPFCGRLQNNSPTAWGPY